VEDDYLPTKLDQCKMGTRVQHREPGNDRDGEKNSAQRNSLRPVSRRALAPPNGSAFSGVAQPYTAALDTLDSAILPRAISAERCHVRCNGLLGGGLEANRHELRNDAAPMDGFGIAQVMLAKPFDEETFLIACPTVPERNYE